MRWTSRDTRSLGIGLAYLAPSLVLFAAFVFIPLAQTIYLSFYNTRASGAITTFAGLDHYLELLTSPAFRTGLLATAIFALYTVPIGIALGLVLAVLLNQRLRAINVFRTMMSSTIAISAAVGALIWLLLFNPSLGLLNYVLSRVGVHGPEWLIQPTTAIIAVSITTIWLTLGTNIIVLLSGLQGVPEEIYEAARLDGARGLRMFTRITIPMVSPSLFFLLVVDTVAVKGEDRGAKTRPIWIHGITNTWNLRLTRPNRKLAEQRFGPVHDWRKQASPHWRCERCTPHLHVSLPERSPTRG